MQKTYCDICKEEIPRKHIEDCYIRLDIGGMDFQWDLCKKCKDRLFTSIEWMLKDY